MQRRCSPIRFLLEEDEAERFEGEGTGKGSITEGRGG